MNQHAKDRIEEQLAREQLEEGILSEDKVLQTSCDSKNARLWPKTKDEICDEGHGWLVQAILEMQDQTNIANSSTFEPIRASSTQASRGPPAHYQRKGRRSPVSSPATDILG
jgi:hypothetical protein